MHFAGQNMHKYIFKLNAAGSNPLIIQYTCIPSFNMNQVICKILVTLEDTNLVFDQTQANQYDFLSLIFVFSGIMARNQTKATTKSIQAIMQS